MHMEKYWLLWFILGAILLVGEMFTAGFFLMWFGIGAILAGILDLLGLGPAWQWGVFLVSSLILVIASKKFADTVTEEEPEPIGANRMLKREGIVSKEIDPVHGGMVKIDGEEWRALSADDSKIPLHSKIVVEKVEGTKLIVHIKEEA
jgi:membrane protein implicated in regulation of membrane protease activity